MKDEILSFILYFLQVVLKVRAGLSDVFPVAVE
jgi:hypothetical protein